MEFTESIEKREREKNAQRTPDQDVGLAPPAHDCLGVRSKLICLVPGLHLNWKGTGLTVWTRGDFSDADVDRQTVQGGQRRFVCSCQTGPKGQEGVSEFNLITWEGPAEPVEPYMQPTEFETKENVNSGNTVENPPNIPAAAPNLFFFYRPILLNSIPILLQSLASNPKRFSTTDKF